MALSWPVNAPVTQNFGAGPSSIQPNGHTGMDFGVPVGTVVRAAGAGTVVFANWATTLSANNPWWIAPAFAGICVVIDHGGGLLTLYAHLNVTNLNAGNRVAQGQEIGRSGNTGLSTGPHLHFEVIGWPLAPYNGFYGRLNPTKYVTSIAPAGNVTGTLKANQRLVGSSTVNQRNAANSKAAVVRVIPAKSVEEFTGYVIGESISNINIWYKDAKGYAWAGGFESQSTAGLPNLTPISLKANQRLVGADNVNHRTQPNNNSTVVRVIPAKTIETFTGYVIGESIAGINIWYKDAAGYAWAGGFESQSTAGLTNQTPVDPNLAKTRVAGAQSVNMRALPFSDSEVIRVIPGGSKEIFTNYVIGDKVGTIDIWFKDAQGYAWAGGFESQAVTGLTKLPTPVNPNDVVKPPVTPPVVKPPVVDPPVVEPPVVIPPPVNSLKGIDISNHQKGIDISKLDADFVIVKATEGVGWSDPLFKINVTTARAAGKLIGFYHFARPLATPENTPENEAQSFLNTISAFAKDGDIFVLDWEAENQSNVAWAKAWLDYVALATKSAPLVYMNLSTSNAYDWSPVSAKYPLWLAQYPSSAKQGWGPIGTHGVPKGWVTVMWQYTSTGNITGWAGDLDLNIFFGTKEDYKLLGMNSVDVVEPPVVDPPIDPEPVPPVEDQDLTPEQLAEKQKIMEILNKAINEYLANKQV